MARKAAEALAGGDVVHRSLGGVQQVGHINAHFFPLLEVAYQFGIVLALIVVDHRIVLARIAQNTQLVAIAQRIHAAVANVGAAVVGPDDGSVRVLLMNVLEEFRQLFQINLVAVLIAELVRNVGADGEAGHGSLVQQAANAIQLAVDAAGLIHILTQSLLHLLGIGLQQAVQLHGLSLAGYVYKAGANAGVEHVQGVVAASQQQVHLLGSVANLDGDELNIAADLLAGNLAESRLDGGCVSGGGAAGHHQGDGGQVAGVFSRAGAFRRAAVFPASAGSPAGAATSR